MPETDCLTIRVEPYGDKYAVVMLVNDVHWRRLGPYDDLDEANMICREALARAQRLAAKYKVSA
jgi:hypothetical protein